MQCITYNTTHTSELKCTSINTTLFKVWGVGPPGHWQTLRVITTKPTLGHNMLHFCNVLPAMSHLKADYNLVSEQLQVHCRPNLAAVCDECDIDDHRDADLSHKLQYSLHKPYIAAKPVCHSALSCNLQL